MSNKIHVVKVNDDGKFYCRAVGSELNHRLNEQVCGKGCPYYIEPDYKGTFKCCYVDSDEQVFPRVEGLDERLYEAYLFAADAHKGQVRKGTQIPYFSHIITTLNYAMELTDNVDVLTAAILHDTVEDTSVTIKDIVDRFGKKVAELVAYETEDKRSSRPASETWELRKQETIMHLQDMPADAKIIVLSDKTANAESLVKEWRVFGDEIWNKFNQHDKWKHYWYYSECAKALKEFSDTIVMKKLWEYLDELFAG
ncbi:MAG: HD domain-containing protein [Lachnospiraceae bacterium]|nr:HD domain-containing protein [Lachnospiraceae bacterium]MBQ2406033.1 HD domain-containing protein [Lachnospiraceae bacterium]